MRVVRQPDGMFAIWSSIVDDWMCANMSPNDVEDMFVEAAVRESKLKASRAIGAAIAVKEGDQHSFAELERWRRKVHGGAK